MARYRFPYSFSMRTLLIAIALVAIGCAVLVRFEPFRSRILAARLRTTGAKQVILDRDIEIFVGHKFDPNLVHVEVNESTRLDQVRALIRPPNQVNLYFSTDDLPPNWAQDVAQLENLTGLYFVGKDITDDDIVALSGMQKLEVLDLTESNISDKSVPVFKSMPSLKHLFLRNTQLTIAGYRELLATPIEYVGTSLPRPQVEEVWRTRRKKARPTP